MTRLQLARNLYGVCYSWRSGFRQPIGLFTCIDGPGTRQASKSQNMPRHAVEHYCPSHGYGIFPSLPSDTLSALLTPYCVLW